MANVKAHFFLPLQDNDGRKLGAEMEDVKASVYAAFGGWTSTGRVQGTYRMADGSQAADKCRAFMVVLDESRLPELEQILRSFKERTLQEAIYLEVQRYIDIRFIR